MGQIWLSRQRNAARTTTSVLYDWSLLNNSDIRDEYILTLRNTFDALQAISETPTPNNEYKNFVTDHVEAAAECMPTKEREKLVVRKKRADVKTASQRERKNTTKTNAQKLKERQNDLTEVYLKEQTE